MSGQDVDDPITVRPRWVPLVVTWEPDGTVLSASDSYAAQLGLPMDQVVGRQWPELVSGEEEMCRRQLLLTVGALAATDLLVVDMPTRVGGRTEWFRWNETAVRDAEGRLVRISSTGIEITELYEARAELAAAIDHLAAAREQGRRDVLEQLHNGAVQQLTAARWAVAAGDQEDAGRLIDAALTAVRASMESLDPLPGPSTKRLPPEDPYFRWVADQSADGALPPHIRSALTDIVADAVAVLSSTGAVWLDADSGFDAFAGRTDVDMPLLLAVVHPDDRAEVAAASVRALAGEEARVRWRYRHGERGWRQMYTWMTPMPTSSTGPRLAAALSLDITRVDGDPVREVMEARLDERSRVAQALHDDVLQRIAGLRWALTEQGAAERTLAELDDVEVAVRRRLRELNEPVSRFGLEAALLHLLDATTTPTEVRLRGVDRVPDELGDVVWRCVREALRNVDRHAAARRASVTVDGDGPSVRVEVVDDGTGLDEQQMLAAVRSGHLGVASMREAVTAAGGRLQLGARDGGGTILRVELPVASRADGQR